MRFRQILIVVVMAAIGHTVHARDARLQTCPPECLFSVFNAAGEDTHQLRIGFEGSALSEETKSALRSGDLKRTLLGMPPGKALQIDIAADPSLSGAAAAQQCGARRSAFLREWTAAGLPKGRLNVPVAAAKARVANQVLRAQPAR